MTEWQRRPIFSPTQVMKLGEIQIGREFTVNYFHYTERVRILSEPYQSDDGGWWVKVEVISERVTREREMSLADAGVMPYSSGSWNDTNYTTFV